MTAPEFSRLVDIRQAAGQDLRLSASEAERAALAARFALVRIVRLEAEISLERDGDNINATGILGANIIQSCAISGEDLPVAICEPLKLRFVPGTAATRSPQDIGEEVELAPEELDEIPFSSTTFDMGEAVAQSLALAIDPFLVGPEADRVRGELGLVGEEAAGPFAALAALKDKGRPDNQSD